MKIPLSKLKQLEKRAREIHRGDLIRVLIVNSEEEIEEYRDRLAPGATIIIDNIPAMRRFLDEEA